MAESLPPPTLARPSPRRMEPGPQHQSSPLPHSNAVGLGWEECPEPGAFSPPQGLSARVTGVECHTRGVLIVSPKLSLVFKTFSSPPRSPSAPAILFEAHPAFSAPRALTQTVGSASSALFPTCLKNSRLPTGPKSNVPSQGTHNYTGGSSGLFSAGVLSDWSVTMTSSL